MSRIRDEPRYGRVKFDGSVKEKVEPTPGVLSTQTSPPCACTRCFTIDEAEARAALLARAAAVDAVEALEDARAVGLGDADALVGDLDAHAPAVGRDAHLDLADRARST